MIFRIQPNVPQVQLDGVKFEVSADYQSSGIQLSWKLSSDDPARQFGFRILSSRQEPDDSPEGRELLTEGSFLVSDLLSSYEIIIECYDLGDTTQPIAYIIIEDMADL